VVTPGCEWGKKSSQKEGWTKGQRLAEKTPKGRHKGPRNTALSTAGSSLLGNPVHGIARGTGRLQQGDIRERGLRSGRARKGVWRLATSKLRSLGDCGSMGIVKESLLKNGDPGLRVPTGSTKKKSMQCMIPKAPQVQMYLYQWEMLVRSLRGYEYSEERCAGGWKKGGMYASLLHSGNQGKEPKGESGH